MLNNVSECWIFLHPLAYGPLPCDISQGRTRWFSGGPERAHHKCGSGVGKGIVVVFAMAEVKKLVITSRTLAQLDEAEQAIEAEWGRGKSQ